MTPHEKLGARMNGILIIDKPEGMTSHDVVHRIRKIFNIAKAGHLGTLDPLATGVLPVCVGKATRLAQFLPSSPKEYTGEIRFGFSTNTYDREGFPAGPEVPFDGAKDDIRRMMQSLTGVLDQVPPPFSAKKIAGVRSYKLARTNRQQDDRRAGALDRNRKAGKTSARLGTGKLRRNRSVGDGVRRKRAARRIGLFPSYGRLPRKFLCRRQDSGRVFQKGGETLRARSPEQPPDRQADPAAIPRRLPK